VAPRKGKIIEDRAKDAGATGARLSAAKQALRDSLIVTRKGQGFHTHAIAAEAGVSVRTVHRVLAEREAVGEALLDRDPIDVVKGLAAQLEASAADFEAMACAYADVNPAAAIGAKKGADQAREKLLLLLQATGRLPRDMGRLRDLMDIRQVAEEMVEAVRDFRDGKIEAAEIEETFRRSLTIGRPQPELAQTAA